MFSGAANVIFKEAATNDGKDTVPEGQKFVGDSDQDVMIVN